MLFPEKYTTHYASKFRRSSCPLRKQVKFSEQENIKCRGYKKDPLGETEVEIESGFLRKYKGRLLVLASNECAINCRFCFRRNRRHKKYNDLPKRLAEILKRDKSIKEVILSGGDPLMLKHGEIMDIFKSIPKNLNIRIHSRVPIAMPSKFTPEMFSLFKQNGERMVLVVHTNHANELDSESEKIFQRLAKYKITLLNQSVLLKGINNNAKTLAELSEKLFSQGVLPYYLHVLDKANGASHFDVPISEAKAIFNELKGLLPGYLVPKLVRELKGKSSKTWIGSG